jgi:hypothetical protein
MEGSHVRAIGDVSSGGGKVIILDVPLCGNSQIVTKFHVHRCSKDAAVSMRVIEEKNGGQIGSASMTLIPDSQRELTIPLYDVYVRSALVFEFTEATDLLVQFDAIQLH